MNQRQLSSGISAFSLIELSVVLAIIAAIISSVLVLVERYHDAQEYDNTVQIMQDIEEALERHVALSGFLPCPAPANAAPDTALFNIATDCALPSPAGVTVVSSETGNADDIMIGALPTRSLNLPDSHGVDAWNMRLRYVVVRNLALSPNAFQDYVPHINVAMPITINDASGNAVTALAPVGVTPAYIVLSHGQDTKGAWVRNGSEMRVCTAGFADSDNCNNDRVFISRERSPDNAPDANYFDDIIIWQSQLRLNKELGTP